MRWLLCRMGFHKLELTHKGNLTKTTSSYGFTQECVAMIWRCRHCSHQYAELHTPTNAETINHVYLLERNLVKPINKKLLHLVK